MNEEPKQIKCYCGHTSYCDCSPIEEPKQGLNLPLLEQKLDEALSNETEESLNTWLKEKRDKQETLEETAEKYGNNIGNKNGTAQFDFIQGAKWMQERSYIEANKIIEFLDNEAKLKISDTKTIERIKWYFETYFKQFKKK